MKNEIKVFTDGSSKGNPGPGGWGAIVDFGPVKSDDHGAGSVKSGDHGASEEVFEIGGGDKRTTNNRMELTAVVEVLEFLENKNYSSSLVRFYTDSSYVAKGATTWINNWRRNNWKNKTGQEVANVDLWQKLDNLLNIFEIKMENIEGHVGIPANERADEIATSFADENKPTLFVGKKFLYKVDLEDTSTDDKKVATKKRSTGKAYSYLSLVDGEFRIHQTWPECEARVKGRQGVKFKKALSAEDETKIKASWGF